ncbi:MAG: ATP-binding protein [Deltaproteobacteria bacterium]|nr:ATP-binding protein [Deltaproteobacteria bacterium]
MDPMAMTCKALLENLDEVLGFIESCADRFGLKENRKFGLLIAVEEAFVNVCHYAYGDKEGEAELVCSGDGGSFVVEIADRGIEFNVLSLPDPDTTTNIMERKIGGLGVFFIRKMTDDLSYQRKDGRNILRMVLHAHDDSATS